MFHYLYKVIFFVTVIIMSTASLGISDQYENQDILANSKIKEKSFKKVFGDIKKTLPKELRKCQIEVIDIKLLKNEGSGVGENWTVKVCQDTKEYLVTTFHPKGYYCNVIPKEEALAKEKRLWEGDKETWRNALYYIDEIEAMDQSNKNEDTEVKYIEYTIDGIPQKHRIEVKKKE